MDYNANRMYRFMNLFVIEVFEMRVFNVTQHCSCQTFPGIFENDKETTTVFASLMITYTERVRLSIIYQSTQFHNFEFEFFLNTFRVLAYLIWKKRNSNKYISSSSHSLITA